MRHLRQLLQQGVQCILHHLRPGHGDTSIVFIPPKSWAVLPLHACQGIFLAIRERRGVINGKRTTLALLLWLILSPWSLDKLLCSLSNSNAPPISRRTRARQCRARMPPPCPQVVEVEGSRLQRAASETHWHWRVHLTLTRGTGSAARVLAGGRRLQRLEKHTSLSLRMERVCWTSWNLMSAVADTNLSMSTATLTCPARITRAPVAEAAKRAADSHCHPFSAITRETLRRSASRPSPAPRPRRGPHRSFPAVPKGGFSPAADPVCSHAGSIACAAAYHTSDLKALLRCPSTPPPTPFPTFFSGYIIGEMEREKRIGFEKNG